MAPLQSTLSGGAERGEAGAGVQVVRLGAGAQRYELDEAALRRLLLRPDVHDLPVVVVSVAGALRGGKSFILNFLRRYLNAPRSSQLSGEWLGTENEQLKGFHWRRGIERDTTGIHLWPEPIITTTNTGEKVAVLLMDTQGIFDPESTIAQNTGIFALSTLISSVQIYNLSGNIRGDHLQYLQLFTKYGKLACQAEGKAFQTLLFLVRDWTIGDTHGYEGGAALLQKTLQAVAPGEFMEESNPNQNSELREVREHVCSCFDQIKCFLMPHPGLSVADQSFAGCLRDLTEKFKLALLDLVPSLLDPEHLTLKVINGERVRTQDLLGYFQKYIEIFNNDEMPEAVTIFKATADACLQAATRAARSLYAARMAERVRGARSVTGSALRAAHADARAAVVLCFAQKKQLVSQEHADAQLKKLLKELDANLSQYVLNNNSMVQKTMSDAKKTYDAAVSKVCECGVHAHLFLHPDDLVKLHAESLQEALTLFDAARDVPENEEDDQREALVQSLKQQYDHLCAINERNSKNAVLKAHNFYMKLMKFTMDHGAVSSNNLKNQHHYAAGHVKKTFNEKRKRSSDREDDDLYFRQLLEKISSSFAYFEKSNIENNRTAIQAAEFTYNKVISSEWGQPMCCFHPQALKDLHKKAVEEAVKQFMTEREESEDDEYKAALITNLKIRFNELQTTNKFHNEQAVKQAFSVYKTKMDEHTRTPVLCVPAISYVKSLPKLSAYHESSKQLAINEFMSKRRGETYGDDEYYNELMQKLETDYTNYRVI